jgi:hypothetical protein
MKDDRDDDYLVLFRGAKISKRESNKVGLALICGFIALTIAIPLFGTENNIMVLSVMIGSSMAGYFFLAYKTKKR